MNFASYFEKALGTIKSIVTFRFLVSFPLAVIPFLLLALAIIIYFKNNVLPDGFANKAKLFNEHILSR